MPSTAINTSSSGDNTIVAAVAGYGIRVIAFVLTYGGTVNLTWKSSGGTVLGGPYLGVGVGSTPPPVIADDLSTQTRGHYTTLKGEGLVLNLSAAVAVGGHVVWETAAL